MYTHPKIIQAMVKRLCEFYLEANELFYRQAGDLIDAHFMGNDFGTQDDLLISPEIFGSYYLPWLKKFADQAHRFGYHSVLHSCGSIYRIIDQLIDAGIDCIHPIQALATNMSAEYLAEHFGGRIRFMGGIDTQKLLSKGTPDDVRRETSRVIDLLAPDLIVSPSHEALMPDVPPGNLIAIANTVMERRTQEPNNDD
jgi:uroporphyrinogen decarboxylase